MRRLEVHPNADNTTLTELELAQQASPTQRGFIRLSAIRALVLGFDRPAVCQLYRVSDRMLRHWIHWFNQAGVDGLISRRESDRGRRPKIALRRLEDILVPALEDPQRYDQWHWTGRKIHGFLEAQFQVELGYSTVIRYLHELGYVLRFPRPWATGPGKDEAQRERFAAELSELRQRADIRLWFGDETGIEGDPRPRRRWAVKGSDPKMDYHGGHLRRTVIGAVAPQSGEFFAMLFDGCNTDVFQVWLDILAEECPPIAGKSDYLILDNATWHKVKSLNWHHFQAVYLPPYSPDFNPIERLWKLLKERWFADFYTREANQLEDRILLALKALIDDPKTVKSATAFR